MIHPKRTDFYKNGKLVKSITGKGVFDANEWTGTYRIWASNGNSYYEFKCLDCEVVEIDLARK